MSTLLIYTGGTIGMVRNHEGTLCPFTLKNLLIHCPNLEDAVKGNEIEAISMKVIKDSSNFSPSDWLLLRNSILNHHEPYNSIVVLHGTDTMAFTASAISYLMYNFEKNIVFTGSQIPISDKNSDGVANIDNALLLLDQLHQKDIKRKILLSFGGKTIYASTAYKVSTVSFEAFKGREFSIHDVQTTSNVTCPSLLALRKIQSNVCLIKLYPGIQLELLASNLLKDRPKGIIIESFGSGNMPENMPFIQALAELIAKGTLVVNISQCSEGRVDMAAYQTGEQLLNIGVLDGKNMTTEAAMTKLMLILSVIDKNKAKLMTTSLVGEIIN